MIEVQQMTPIAEKQEQPFICMCDQGPLPTEDEQLFELVADRLYDVPMLLNSVRWINVEVMSPHIQEHIVNILKCILRETGMDFFQRVLFEIR